MIWEELNQKQNELDSCLRTLRQNGEAFAKAKQNYAIRLRQEILMLKEMAYPVTLITDIAKGDDEVAELRLLKDIAEAVYKANLEAINIKKLELNILKVQFDKEYSNG